MFAMSFLPENLFVKQSKFLVFNLKLFIFIVLLPIAVWSKDKLCFKLFSFFPIKHVY